MSVSSFDFDVITGPSVQRDARQPAPGSDPAQSQPASLHSDSGAAEHAHSGRHGGSTAGSRPPRDPGRRP